MNLDKAIDRAKESDKTSVVNEGLYGSSDSIGIRVRPIGRIDESQDHYIIDNHTKKIDDKVLGNIESKEDLPDNGFIIQFVETENKMSDIVDTDKEKDVFDENVFVNKENAIKWIQKVGYIN